MKFSRAKPHNHTPMGENYRIAECGAQCVLSVGSSVFLHYLLRLQIFVVQKAGYNMDRISPVGLCCITTCNVAQLFWPHACTRPLIGAAPYNENTNDLCSMKLNLYNTAHLTVSRRLLKKVLT